MGEAITAVALKLGVLAFLASVFIGNHANKPARVTVCAFGEVFCYTGRPPTPKREWFPSDPNIPPLHTHGEGPTGPRP